ncbi:hypothetical protein KC19_3G070500 [Ceratodon purpureus]|uniref:Uncharacterized protein n=1 Tax=Ceratodon purpureus TaxID=3225 RepID=A0A8T0IHT5_CERPU|nr:hypothetical protein KC19_3G070500 [Ceratodon purpureus]
MEESALLNLIEVLGDTLARLQVTLAKEEYGLQQIVASIKFVNSTIESRVNSSQQQVPESSEVYVYESDMSEVSKSIDAILDEARTARGTSKPSAIPKGPSSTSRDVNIAETRRKSNESVHKKKSERFSQALRTRPKKNVSSKEDAAHSSFAAAQETLLKWMENKKDRAWINAHAERLYLNSTRQSSPCFERKTREKSNAEKRFLERLWSIGSIPPNSLRNELDNASGGDLNERGHGNDDPNTKGSEDEVQTTTQPFQTHIDEVLQAHRKLLNEGHLNAEHVYGGEDLPVMIPSVEEKQQHTGNHEKKSVANDDCWLSAEICWKVLGKQATDILLKHGTQAIPTFYSDLQEALKMTQLLHSIHTKIFNCYLQSLLAESFLKSSTRVEDLLSNPSVYTCFRLAHSLVFNNGKALLSIARRVDIES